MNSIWSRLRPGRRGWQLSTLLFTLLCFAGGAAVSAQQAGQATNPFRAGGPSGIRETTLPNGLKVITREVHTAPVVFFSVWYRVGARNEHNGITGVSHLLEHMMFKGTKKYGLGEISRSLFINGANFNANTSFDWTSYFETLSSDRLELAMQIESDRMMNSRVDKSDLDSEMTVVRSELEGNENNPSTLLNQAVEATAFQAHPYHWPVIGWRSDVENVPQSLIYQYYKTHYGPNNAAIVMVGDFSTEKALQMVHTYFSGLPKIPTPLPVYTQEPLQRGERRVTVRRAGSLPLVEIAYKNPAQKSSDNYALDLLGTILSSGRTSRLYHALVESQLATEADADNSTLRDPFLFSLTATAHPGVSADKVEQALLEQVEQVRDTPVTDEELARAKSQTEASFIFQNDSVSAQGRFIGMTDATVGDWHYLATYLDRIRAVTPADIQRVAQKYLTRDARTVGQFIPSSQGGAAGPPPREASARVEKPKQGQRLLPLPKPGKATASKRNISRFQLSNGVSVVVAENPSSPTFALRGTIPAGSVLEPRDKRNLAVLTAAMLTRGTRQLSAREFARGLENVGAALSSSADELTATVSGHAQSKDFDLVIDRMSEMLREPAFPDDELQRLKGQVLAGIEEEKDDPESIATRAFGRAIYPEGNPLRPDTLDEAQREVQSITRDDLESYYRQQYGPDRMILVIAGDVKANQVRQSLEQRIGSWARNSSARPIPTLDVPLQGSPTREVIQVPDKSQAAILWGHAGLLKRSDPDFYATQIMNTILGGGTGLSSRLATSIRDEQGLVYTVFSFYDSNLYPGPFQVSMGTNPANVQKAVTALNAQIARVQKSGFTQREVDEAVAFVTGSFPVRLETNAGLASTLWAMEFYHLGSDYLDRYAGYYRSVTLAQVNAAAKKHLHPERATLVISGTVPGLK